MTDVVNVRARRRFTRAFISRRREPTSLTPTHADFTGAIHTSFLELQPADYFASVVGWVCYRRIDDGYAGFDILR